jgi:hypothetical protein
VPLKLEELEVRNAEWDYFPRNIGFIMIYIYIICIYIYHMYIYLYIICIYIYIYTYLHIYHVFICIYIYVHMQDTANQHGMTFTNNSDWTIWRSFHCFSPNKHRDSLGKKSLKPRWDVTTRSLKGNICLAD